MDPSTIASWGSREDRPLRDQLRGLLIGRDFMVQYCDAEGGKNDHDDSAWFPWVRKRTVAELRWMWDSDRAFKAEHREAYAQVAGEVILEATAKGSVQSTRWFSTDINEVYGWLFEPACLEHDGWILFDLELRNGTKVKSWKKARD